MANSFPSPTPVTQGCRQADRRTHWLEVVIQGGHAELYKSKYKSVVDAIFQHRHGRLSLTRLLGRVERRLIVSNHMIPMCTSAQERLLDFIGRHVVNSENSEQCVWEGKWLDERMLSSGCCHGRPRKNRDICRGRSRVGLDSPWMLWVTSTRLLSLGLERAAGERRAETVPDSEEQRMYIDETEKHGKYLCSSASLVRKLVQKCRDIDDSVLGRLPVWRSTRPTLEVPNMIRVNAFC